jgi:hypothetical protein
MTYRPSSELPERPRAEIETDAHIEGNLATEVSFIILDTLERIVQVKVTVRCIKMLVTIAWLSCPLPPVIALFKMITNLIRIYGEKLLPPCPTLKLEDHPVSAVRDCLFNVFTATLRIGSSSSIRNLRTCYAEVTGTNLSQNIRYIHIFLCSCWFRCHI